MSWLTLELEKLGSHFRGRLPRFSGFGAAADWHLELAWWVNYVSATPTKKAGSWWVGTVVQLIATYLWR